MRVIDVILVFIVQYSVSAAFDITKKPDPEKVCFQLPNVGLCYKFSTKMWFYDFKLHICREFYYGGCGGNDNRFQTEKDCYAICKERLVFLHPPANVTVGYTLDDTIFLYWYPPMNYDLHVENETVKGTPVTDRIATIKTDLSPTKSTSKPTTESVNARSTPLVQNQSTKGPTNVTEVTSDPKDNITDNTDSKNRTEDINIDSKNSTNNKTENDSGANNNSDREGSGTENGYISLEGGLSLNLSDYIGRNPVPFHFAKLKHYILSYRTEGKEFTNRTIAGNETEAKIEGLSDSTKYYIILTAVYMTNTSIPSPQIIAQTRRDKSRPKECHCDKYGTVGGYRACNLSLSQLPWCPCRPRYMGLFCEMCARGYYRTTPSLPCHDCPCDSYSSTGSCYFVDSYLRCARCKEGYTGQLCHRCSNGYYRDLRSSPSLCKKCEGCHDIKPGLICDPFTGSCLNCHYNTTGQRCDKCLDGFVGDPSKNISCVPMKVSGKKTYTPPPTALIAAIVVAIIVVLSLIIGCVIYSRKRSYPALRPFWTVELKEDHEGVNFSSVPDQDLDDSFHEKESKNKSKSQPYSQLKEEI